MGQLLEFCAFMSVSPCVFSTVTAMALRLINQSVCVSKSTVTQLQNHTSYKSLGVDPHMFCCLLYVVSLVTMLSS